MARNQPDDQRPQHGAGQRKDADVMRGRDLAGAEYGTTEEEQTRERERAGHDRTDEVGEITETELDEGEV